VPSPPTAAELVAAHGGTIPDVLAPDLDVLFCGINPGLYSAATGHHFARPGNRFWPALHRSGFVPRQLRPAEQEVLLEYRLGITNVVARGTARADELTPAEFVAGGRILADKVRRYRPRWLAVLGVTAYRTAFGYRDARVGRQDFAIDGTHVWVLPNPSGLNAHYTLPRLVAEFAALRDAVPSRPEPDCWLHPDVEVRPSPIAGKGLFARAPIPRGTVVSRVGGRLVSEEELRALFAVPDHPYIDTVTVTDGTHLVLPPRRPNGYGNHSCDPNLWWVGPYELAARRDIATGEEVTNDYATSTGTADFRMDCACGTGLCRGVVTGTDWRLPELRDRYGEHWTPALVARIRAG
jgi:G:T/U-mismatch repair DNA glycosylase